MRRALASALLALFTIPLIVPALTAISDSNLPACCRRDGKHHCAMSDAAESPSGPTASAVQPKCPVYPKISTSPVVSQTMLLAALPHWVAPQTFASRLHRTSGDASSVFNGSFVRSE